MGRHCAARQIGEFLGGNEESHSEVRAISKNWPDDESRARGSYTGAYLLGGILAALLLLRFGFAS
jgi:hypothetical protein